MANGLLAIAVCGALSGMASCSDEEEVLGVTPPVEEKPCNVRELSCRRGDLRIYGQFYTPEEAEGPLPTVILAHSANLTGVSLDSYARKLAAKGYAAYCFDFCGACDDSRSDGSTDDMTVFTEVDDLKQVVLTMQQQEEVRPDALFLWGTSQGGLVSALAAEELGAQIRGLILFYPAFNIPDLVRKMNGQESGNGSIWGGLFGGSMGEAFTQSLLEYDVYQHIGTYEGEVLICHGEKDFIVPVSYSEQALALYPHAELYVIQGATHGFNAANLGGSQFAGLFGDYDGEVVPLVLDYVARNIPATEP